MELTSHGIFVLLDVGIASACTLQLSGKNDGRGAESPVSCSAQSGMCVEERRHMSVYRASLSRGLQHSSSRHVHTGKKWAAELF